METITKTVIYAVLQIPRKSELGSVGSKVAKTKKKWAELQIHNNGSTDDKFFSFTTVYITATIYGCDCDYLRIGGVALTLS